jgi:hypothetical protein
MGCGASNYNIATTPTRVDSTAIASNTKMANLNASQTTTDTLFDLISSSICLLLFFHLVSSANTTKILIASHSTQQTISERLKQELLNQHLSCYLLNESTPHALHARANAIQWCDVFVVLISRLYQRTSFCMEALNYAKDMHKPIISILAERTFQPYGALGAISTSAIRSLVLSDDTTFVHVASNIASSVRTQVTKKTNDVNVTDPSQVKTLYYDC